METLHIYPSSVNDRFIARAAEIMRRGGIIIYPTDTLYAIGCSALCQQAIEKVCRLKDIDTKRDTLSIVCSGISQASEYARIDNGAFNIIRSHTPGPYTFVLPAAGSLPKAFKTRRTVGVRIPDNVIARRIAEELGCPILSTSIPTENLEYEEIVQPGEIALRFEPLQPEAMIDGGEGSDIPSTVVDLTDSSQPEIIREGAGPIDF